MKIVHTEASCGWGGQEIRILTEAAGMIARGHEVYVLCPPESRIFQEASKYNVPAIALPIAKKRWRGLRAIRGFLKQHPDIDVINTHSSTDAWLVGLACGWKTRQKNAAHRPAIVRTRHVSSPVPRNPPTRWLYQYATDWIVTTGEKLKKTLVQHNRFDGNRMVSIPTGLDTKKFCPGDKIAARQLINLPTNATLIGIVATLRSWKGHRYLLQAFAAILHRQSQSPLMLVIVGDGPQREALEALATELNISEHIIFAGNQENVVPWLQAFDMFVLPSYANEGVSQALMQAMLCGLPCITTQVGSMGEIAKADETALIVPTEDSVAIQLGLEKLINESDYSNALGRQARDFCVAHCSLEQMLARMEWVFEQALTKR